MNLKTPRFLRDLHKGRHAKFLALATVIYVFINIVQVAWVFFTQQLAHFYHIPETFDAKTASYVIMVQNFMTISFAIVMARFIIGETQDRESGEDAQISNQKPTVIYVAPASELTTFPDQPGSADGDRSHRPAYSVARRIRRPLRYIHRVFQVGRVPGQEWQCPGQRDHGTGDPAG